MCEEQNLSEHNGDCFAVVKEAVIMCHQEWLCLRTLQMRIIKNIFCFLCSQDADLPGAPENLTFRERQRLFSQGQDVSNKVKASRKLMELENELNTK